jgi:hypothetical protein
MPSCEPPWTGRARAFTSAGPASGPATEHPYVREE